MQAQVTSATVSRDGIVTAVGTVQCDRAGSADISLQTAQTASRFIAQGSGYVWAQCDTSPTTFTVAPRSWGPVKLSPGRMTLTGGVFAYDAEWNSVWEELTPQTLKVRRKASAA